MVASRPIARELAAGGIPHNTPEARGRSAPPRPHHSRGALGHRCLPFRTLPEFEPLRQAGSGGQEETLLTRIKRGGDELRVTPEASGRHGPSPAAFHGQVGLLALQRLAGNRAVANMLAPVQRTCGCGSGTGEDRLDPPVRAVQRDALLSREVLPIVHDSVQRCGSDSTCDCPENNSEEGGSRQASAPVAQRQVLVQEPAGGCGVCERPLHTGNCEHWLLESRIGGSQPKTAGLPATGGNAATSRLLEPLPARPFVQRCGLTPASDCGCRKHDLSSLQRVETEDCSVLPNARYPASEVFAAHQRAVAMLRIAQSKTVANDPVAQPLMRKYFKLNVPPVTEEDKSARNLLRVNLASMNSGASDVTYECESTQSWWNGACSERTRAVTISNVHLCPEWWTLGPHQRAVILLHELAHDSGFAFEGLGETYCWDSDYPDLPSGKLLINVDAYAAYISELATGIVLCPSG